MFKLRNPFEVIAERASSAGESLANGWNSVVNAGSNLVQEAANSITQGTSGVVDTAVTLVSDLASNAQAALDSAADAIDSAVAQVSELVAPVADNVQSAIAGAGDWVDAKAAEFQESPVDALATMTPAYLVASALNPDVSRTPISDLINAASDAISDPIDGILEAKDWITNNWPWLIGGVVFAVVVIFAVKSRMLRRLVRG